VGGGVVATVTALAFRGGGTAPATAATAVVTIGSCCDVQLASLLFPFLLFFYFIINYLACSFSPFYSDTFLFSNFNSSMKIFYI